LTHLSVAIAFDGSRNVREAHVVKSSGVPAADEFRKNYSIAKDKGEIEAFHEIRMSTRPLVTFIDDNRLYDSIGLAACFSLMHNKRVQFAEIQDEFSKIQTNRARFVSADG
jgi:hypothetical protein